MGDGVSRIHTPPSLPALALARRRCSARGDQACKDAVGPLCRLPPPPAAAAAAAAVQVAQLVVSNMGGSTFPVFFGLSVSGVAECDQAQNQER